MELQLREQRGQKLLAIWNPEKMALTIRHRGMDVVFTLCSDGTYTQEEFPVIREIA